MGTPSSGVQSVLVATDFSSNADRAVERVVHLPVARGARVHLAHVLRDDLPSRLRSSALAEAHRRLKASAELLGRRLPQASVKPVLLHGNPLAELDRLARRLGPDLVVVGRHGARVVADQLLGTLAEGLVRLVGPPVLLVALRAQWPWRRVMVASDGTEHTAAVMHEALALAPGPLERADLVHAYHVPFQGFLAQSTSAEDRQKIRAAYQAEASAALTAAIAACPDVPWKKTLRAGDPRQVLLDQVAHRRTELLCVGSLRRSWLSAALLGSVVQWLVRAARCDVLVVPTVAA